MTALRFSLGLGLVAFAATAWASWPGLTGGDSGELIAASSALSTAHPPGYPLYVCLSKAATLVLWGSLAHRYNLFSALCAAAATALLGGALLRWTRSAAVSAAVALAFVSVPLVLQYATRAEVFSLNLAMAALVLLLAVRCADAPGRAPAALLGLAAGVGLGNHQTLALFAVPLVAVASKGHRAVALAGAAAGFAFIYALVPLGAVLGPEQAWGDVLSARGLIAHVLRADYGTLRLASESTGATTPLLPQLARFAEQHLAALGWAGAPLAVWGALRAPRRDVAIGLVIAWLVTSVGFITLARFPMSSALMASVLERFFLLPLVPAFFLAGLGLTAVSNERLRWGAVAVIAIAAAARYGAFVRTRPEVSRPELYAAALLEPLPARAVLLVRGDLVSNAVRYAQATGMRPDVTVLDQELLTYSWYVARRPAGVVFPGGRWDPGQPGAFSLAELLAANPSRPFFAAGSLKPGDGTTAALGRWPAGLAERLLSAPAEAAPALARAVAADAALLGSTFAVAEAPAQDDPWELALADELWEARHRLAVAQITTADPTVIADGERRLWQLIEQRTPAPMQYWRNAAIAAAKLGHDDLLRRAAAKYLELAPADAPDRAVFESAVH